MTVDPLIQSLKGKLVVSVQAYMGEPPAVDTLIEIESLERAYSIAHPFEQLRFARKYPSRP